MKQTMTIPTLSDNNFLLHFRPATTGGLIFETLRQSIVCLQLRPGTHLSEAELARQLGVSRQPVREALIKLEDVGLVEIRPHRGSYVRLISQREVNTISFFREAVEVAIAREAARNAITADIATLDSILAEQRAIEENDTVGFYRLDRAFHQALALSADREDAWNILDRLQLQMDRVRFLSFPGLSPVRELVEQHAHIVDGIRSHDPDATEATIREHLREIYKSLPKLARQYPDLFTN